MVDYIYYQFRSGFLRTVCIYSKDKFLKTSAMYALYTQGCNWLVICMETNKKTCFESKNTNYHDFKNTFIYYF